MAEANIQFVSDEAGEPAAVIVPIGLWREIASERETAYLLKSDAMRKRLPESLARSGGTSLEDALIELGQWPGPLTASARTPPGCAESGTLVTDSLPA